MKKVEDLLQLNNKNKFVDAICENVTVKILDAAVSAAEQSYLTNKYAGTIGTFLNYLTIYPIYHRRNCIEAYVNNYESKKSQDDAKKNLLILMEGPSQGEGGTGIDSFKWFVLEELSKKIEHKDIVPIHSVIQSVWNSDLDTYGNEAVLRDHHTSSMIRLMREQLSKDQNKELVDLANSKSGNSNNSNNNIKN